MLYTAFSVSDRGYSWFVASSDDDAIAQIVSKGWVAVSKRPEFGLHLQCDDRHVTFFVSAAKLNQENESCHLPSNTPCPATI